MLEVSERGGGAVITVRVVPRASRNEVAGEFRGALRIRLTAPPVDNRANDACRRLLADYLNIPLSAVTILSGERGRTKRILVEGMTAPRLRALCAPHGA